MEIGISEVFYYLMFVAIPLAIVLMTVTGIVIKKRAYRKLLREYISVVMRKVRGPIMDQKNYTRKVIMSRDRFYQKANPELFNPLPDHRFVRYCTSIYFIQAFNESNRAYLLSEDARQKLVSGLRNLEQALGKKDKNYLESLYEGLTSLCLVTFPPQKVITDQMRKAKDEMLLEDLKVCRDTLGKADIAEARQRLNKWTDYSNLSALSPELLAPLLWTKDHVLGTKERSEVIIDERLTRKYRSQQHKVVTKMVGCLEKELPEKLKILKYLIRKHKVFERLHEDL